MPTTTKKKRAKSFLQFFLAIPPFRTWLFQGVPEPERTANSCCNKHFSVTCIHLTLCSCAPLAQFLPCEVGTQSLTSEKA